MKFKRISIILFASLVLTLIFSLNSFSESLNSSPEENLTSKLRITFNNDSHKKVMVKMFNIDHRIESIIQPIYVACAEIQPWEGFTTSARSHNKPPHRYIIYIFTLNDNNNWVLNTKFVRIIQPVTTMIIFNLEDYFESI